MVRTRTQESESQREFKRIRAIVGSWFRNAFGLPIESSLPQPSPVVRAIVFQHLPVLTADQTDSNVNHTLFSASQ